MSASWHDFYQTDLQQVFLPAAVSALFVASVLLSTERRARLADPDPAVRFVARYVLVFALLSIADTVATNPLSRWLGIAGRPAGTALLLAFVLLGDFRVFLLIFRFAEARRRLSRVAARAARWTLVVPLAAWSIDGALRALWPGLPGQSIWLVYELAFLGLALWLRARAIESWLPLREPHAEPLRAVAGFVAVYYGLWAGADVLILIFGLDVGWALRVVPNLLYYGIYAPFVSAQMLAER